MKKRISSTAVALSLAVSMLAGCGNSDQPVTVKETTQAAGSQSQSSVAEDSTTTATASTKDYSSQDPYVVHIVLPGTAKTEDCNEVAELANKILQPKYNTTIELVRVGFGTYTQQINLMLSSGEKLDMYYSNRDNFASSVSNGQIDEIGQYLDEYAPEMKAQISKSDWACTSVGDGVYAVPANKEKAVGWGFTMPKDQADQLGIDYTNIDTEDELEPLLKAAKEKFPGEYPVISNGGTMNTMTTSDDLGGDFGVLQDCTNQSDTKVVDWYETDEYKEIVERRYKWSKEGLIMPDAASNTEPWATMISSKKGFGRFCNVKPGIEAEHEKSTGMPMVVLPMTKNYTTTTRLDIIWCVAHNSEKPERTVQVMNEIYTNPELQNILVNGVEGKHYEYANASKTIVRYPSGVDGSNTTYPSYPWAWLNEMITPVWEGSEETLWKETDAYNKEAIESPAKGFEWDNSNVLNEVTACNNVRNKYANALECGSVDPSVALPKFIKELKDAGVDSIITEKQTQLDKWLADNK